MGAILNFYVSSQKSGRKLIISGVNYRVVELFKLTRVDTLLTIVPTAEDAEKMLL
jgi:anti-anti-sigma regulatory factor